MTNFHQRITDRECEQFWRSAVDARLIDRNARSFLVHDLARMRDRIRHLRAAFPGTTLHALAIKANPLVPILREAVNEGMGLEAASLEEVHLGLAAGCPADRIVFDSPAKTISEISQAFELGMIVNGNDLSEIERMENLSQSNRRKARIGLRVNPEVAAGSIALTSVAQSGSKFGVPLTPCRKKIVDAFTRLRWLQGLHVHIGSQGCSLDSLVESVVTINDLRLEIERARGGPLDFIDIGGGLPAVYLQHASAIEPSEYAERLREAVPDLMRDGPTLVTEFGRAIQAGCGVTFSRVEYVLPTQAIAVIHVGADLLMRPVYRPEDWPHEFFVLDSKGKLKTQKTQTITLAGPLCFSGDIVAREVELPALEPGDWVVVRDTGAYTLGMWSRHCSRGIPAILGSDEATRPAMRLLRPAETPQDLVRFWSGVDQRHA